MSRHRARVRVTGLVQGVFFRDTLRREAQAAGVHGWVRNNPDDSVEAVFEGARGDVEALVAWMRHGPRTARVESAEVSSEPPEGLEGFRVR